MFKMFENLTKAAVSVALTPVTLVVDTIMIPADSVGNRDAYSRTGALLKNAGKCAQEAVKPECEQDG